jgi:hypothetical protein
MDLHTLGGAVGTGITIGAYFPEIARLVRKRRSEGVSITSYLLWSVASGLLLMHAWTIRSPVFIVLTMFQALSCLLICILAYYFRQGRNASRVK